MANIYRAKRDTYTTGQECGQVRRVSYVVRKFHELWSTNGFKSDRSFYPIIYSDRFPAPSVNTGPVTHPGANRARRIVTSLIEANALAVRQIATSTSLL